MAAATGIWNHLSATGQALPSASAMDSSTSSSNSSDSATISANDFLSLLVTELQNQDPTADTDPNEYINQLVNVNSLEQLISINQTLTTAAGNSGATTPTGGLTGTDAPTAVASKSIAVSDSPSVAQSGGVTAMRTAANLADGAARRVPGNLGIPDANPAAERVAKSLGGQLHTHKLTRELQ